MQSRIIAENNIESVNKRFEQIDYQINCLLTIDNDFRDKETRCDQFLSVSMHKHIIFLVHFFRFSKLLQSGNSFSFAHFSNIYIAVSNVFQFTILLLCSIERGAETK